MPLNWISEIAARCINRECQKSEFGIVNRFLIEKPASGRHVRTHPGTALALSGICWLTFQEDIDETQGRAAEPSAQGMADDVPS
jgi:hypothetical protein